MKTAVAMALGAAMVCAGSTFSHAVIVKDGSNTTLFYDNFEGGTIGSTPTAITGTWSTSISTGGGAYVQSTPAPAYEGSKYLQMTRPATAFADFGKQTTGTLHSEFMMYIQSADAAEHGAQVILRDDALSAYAIILSTRSSGNVNYYDGAGYVDSLATYTADTWQKWTLDVNLTTDTYQFSVAGVNGLAVPDSLHEGATDARYLIFSGGGGTHPQYLVDAVPEPTSAVALLGVVGLWASRRRR